MDLSPKDYQKYVKDREKKSPIFKDVIMAFLIGGAICVVGQLIMNGWSAAGLNKEDAGTATSCSLVFLSALLTGLNLGNYYTKAEVDGLLGGKVSNEDFTAYKTTVTNALAGKVDTTTLANYYTSAQVDNLLTGYYTKDEIDTTLESYYTSAQVDTKLADYYTSAQVDNLLTGYYTKTESDSRFVKVENISTAIPNTDTAVDTKVASEKAVKTYVDSKIQAADAMRYKGAVTDATGLPSTAVNGDTYKASTAFTLNGTKVEAGDMLIYNGTTWDVVQGNIDLASLTSGTTDAENRKYAVKAENGTLMVTVNPLTITAEEHYAVDTAVETTTETKQIGDSFVAVEDVVYDGNGHITSLKTKTVTIGTTVTDDLADRIEDLEQAPSTTMLYEDLTRVQFSGTEYAIGYITKQPIGDVVVYMNGVALKKSEYTVNAEFGKVEIAPSIGVDATHTDEFTAYYMHNGTAIMPQ